MLREVRKTSQKRGEPCRAWYTDDSMDVIVWFDEADAVCGFQICYDKGRNEHAFTWFRGKGFRHNRVDDGEQLPRKNLTPILAKDGFVPIDRIMAEYQARSGALPEQITAVVTAKLEECRHT